MKTWIKVMAVGIAVVAVSAFGMNHAAYAEEGVTSLRGQTALDEEPGAADITKQDTGKRFTRNYRQQPPLIPHKIEKYQIDLKANQCLGCHDWPQNVEANAPKISETHYVSPTGVRLNKVSGSRWFCNQCHVPQAETNALVPNTFTSSIDLK
ncbi:nitrate reductase cytochrome c-type subunit [Magnetovibrio sp.]|uniref:nitrate reductase cytochrome c-type subunit n=1 Tax=Magnetovibrio sp. TaxID=2024836 RepID=UPI002F933D8E